MEQITLDMIPNSHTPIAHISQYDSGRHIRFNLQNINLAGGETVTLKIRKTNGELVMKNIENHTSYVEYVSEKADCDVSGKSNCEIVISKDDVVIGSKNFILNVEADPYDNAGVITKTASGRIATFETNIADVLQSLKCEINASGGGGTPSNPIPLVGHTELNLTRCGVNLWDGVAESGYIYNGNEYPSASYWRTKNYIPIAPNTEYYFRASANDGQINWYDINKTFISAEGSMGGADRVATSPANAYFVRFYQPNSSDASDTGVNYPATDTEYHAYNGQTFTVAFGQTVYGGVYDKSGRLTITWGAVDLGSLNWIYTSGEHSRFETTTTLPNAKIVAGNITPNALCSIYKIESMNNVYLHSEDNIIGFDNYVWVYDRSAGSDANAFKTAVTRQMLAYDLATPIVIDVPSISVFAENGTNNVFGDTGDTEVKYLYIA